mmetsp:Transcript_48186/g.111667  ORF Transcript_48186/g.111667 Transcript_48186/m.111667 type:complete len:507 (+) Transcript_48186:54-1574(+)
MVVGAEQPASGDGEPTPRPLTRHFQVHEAGVKEVGEEQIHSCSAEPSDEKCSDEVGSKEELSKVLANRRQQVEVNAQTFESAPKLSTADASHLQGLSLDGPGLQEWLQQFKTPEEDRTPELLAEGLRGRGPVPAHAPRVPGPKEVQTLKALAETLSKMGEEVAAERSRLGVRREEVEAREAELRKLERRLETEQQEQQARQDALRDYPAPQWLVKYEGTMNVGIVGNSGVGKSLMINRLRGVQPGAEGWAPVGVNETTTTVSMYAFPHERQVRLWDFPGVGTKLFPLETYCASMGLRYLDSVIIVTAGRFTQTEIALQTELETHGVPYFMVRSKVDIDIWNNKQDNFADDESTLREIRADLTRQCGGSLRPYVVSLRDVKGFDFPKLLSDAFPCLSKSQWDTSISGWDDAWVMPVQLSQTVAGLQGRWADEKGRFMYYISGLSVHVQVDPGQACTLMLVDLGGTVWWQSSHFIDEKAMRKAMETMKLRWQPKDTKAEKPMWWRWVG